MRLLGSVVAFTAVSLFATRVPAADGRHVRTASSARCPDAAITDVHLGHEEWIDAIWVELSPTEHDDGAAVQVEVSAGASLRKLIVAEHGARGLRFSPGMHGDTFHVALDPDFTAKTGACVERVVLLRDGAEVASVIP
jgi:hypothetical protein